MKFGLVLLLKSQILSGGGSTLGKKLWSGTSLALFSSKSGVVVNNSSKLSSLVTVDETLSALKSKKNIKFIDGTWYLNDKSKGYKEYLTERIKNSRFFGIDEIADKKTDLPHMLPKVQEFEESMSNMGINSDDHIIIYTKSTSFAGPRVWWTFQAFGHQKVSVLQGGFTAWKSHPESQSMIESGPAVPVTNKGKFTATLQQPSFVVNKQQVLEIVSRGNRQIIDARSSGRFQGTAPEPRPGLAGGHIPGSLNLPLPDILQPNDGSSYRSLAEVRDSFKEAGLIMGSDVVFTCGSGVTASGLFFGLHLLGYDMKQLAVYNGSWTEWAAQGSDLPIYNPSQEEGKE